MKLVTINEKWKPLIVVFTYAFLMVIIVSLTYEQGVYEGMKEFCSGEDQVLGKNIEDKIVCTSKNALTTQNNKFKPIMLNLNEKNLNELEVSPWA